MDVDIFFNRIRGELIRLITRELTDLNSAYKAFKGQIMGFYNRVTGNQTQQRRRRERGTEPERVSPIKL